MEFLELFYRILILCAGFIDAIAGGGGLITVPTFSLLVGAGPLAIGTNKIVGAAAAGMALLVYARGGHFSLKKGISFSLAVMVGSFVGSQLGSQIPNDYFRWIMLAICPLILLLVLKKDLLVKQVQTEGSGRSTSNRLLYAGAACGIYDGILGPGGGTIMLLSLLFFTDTPLLLAIGISKFANLLSALSSLGGYAYHGHVDWSLGAQMAVFSLIGAFFGSMVASKKAAQIVRPVLVGVVVLLFFKLLLDTP